ncbi:MAG: alpha/beta fold hydrolase [Proteobacteria bacterium]|nr:alpha/beta fold hydrolase [Pseudomonadota bacterium]
MQDPWIAFRKPRPEARLRLFCFPYAGGGASMYRTWSDAVPQQVEICPVQLPGRENRLRDAPFRRIEPLIERLADALQPYLDRPFAFFGHSMGALVAFELAQTLRRHGRACPAYFFASARRAPHLAGDKNSLHTMTDDELIEELRRLDGTPEKVLADRGLMAWMLPLFRADFEVHETYACSQWEALDCPISAFGAVDDETVSREQIHAWRLHTRSEFVLRLFPGDHFFIDKMQPAVIRAVMHDLVTFVPCLSVKAAHVETSA